MSTRLRIPDGWKLEALPGRDQMLLSTPPTSFMATLDFRYRGFRSGCTHSGKFIGETLTKHGAQRKQYIGRGWKQKLVDDAVTWLKELHV